MLYTPLTKKALRLCFDIHRDQNDKSGLPYVFHPFHLAEQMTDEIATVCALLHDVIEDSSCTPEDLTRMGFPPAVLEVLALLTHDPAVPYDAYVRTLAPHPIARAVKIADLRHNSDLTRLDTVDEYALARNEKYRKALDYLLTFDT
ncbi:MAG: bifunctional (p)ppGpp synthetase/guanosine-3',5'-bis(diphosphate) 3'-pyrophosphohydrolase [Ruminococcaceae bacterium]|nr:bifunctional (p)ppGpp synthetase/guanosine-3',5'-bis(diphosphate) 3'-pyrophosphohydrolase [Oscillospiraceae bacterium]